MNNIDTNNKVIIFDFDGVFVDDFDFHKRHIEEFLNIEISDEDFYKIHSGNVYEDDGIGLELENFDVKKYCQDIHDELVKLPLVNGIGKVLQETQRMGQTFIVSSGCEKNIKDFLEQKSICRNSCTIYGVETNPSKRYKLKKILNETGVKTENVIFITDTLGDILEASEVGIASIAVTWGFQSIDTLERGAPFGFAYDVDELSQLINSYFA